MPRWLLPMSFPSLAQSEVNLGKCMADPPLESLTSWAAESLSSIIVYGAASGVSMFHLKDVAFRGLELLATWDCVAGGVQSCM